MSEKKKVKGIPGSAHNWRLLFNRKSEVVFIYVFLALFILFGATMSPHFLSQRNIRNLLSKNVGLLLVTFGQMFVILLGGVDLSTGSVISLVNVLCVKFMAEGNPASWILALIAAILAGACVGFVNGVLVTRGGIQPIIATLATQVILAGISLLIQPKPGGELPKGICDFFTKGLNYIVPLILAILATACIWMLLNRSRIGRHIVAVGGSENSARSSGIRVERTKTIAFMISGIMAAFAGLYISAYAKSGSPVIGAAYSQDSITAAVVGGASLMGGKASAIGCIASVLILGIVSNILNLMHVSSYYQYVLTGVILMAALTLSAIRSLRK